MSHLKLPCILAEASWLEITNLKYCVCCVVRALCTDFIGTKEPAFPTAMRGALFDNISSYCSEGSQGGSSKTLLFGLSPFVRLARSEPLSGHKQEKSCTVSRDATASVHGDKGCDSTSTKHFLKGRIIALSSHMIFFTSHIHNIIPHQQHSARPSGSNESFCLPK